LSYDKIERKVNKVKSESEKAINKMWKKR